LKRIVLSGEAKADIRAIPQHIAMNILTAIHRLAETGAVRVKELKGKQGEKRLRVGDFRVRFTEVAFFAFTRSIIARTLTGDG
jgi:mRNA-degrading endonuclease RelE of RelBE toxin-antitoxin system